MSGIVWRTIFRNVTYGIVHSLEYSAIEIVVFLNLFNLSGVYMTIICADPSPVSLFKLERSIKKIKPTSSVHICRKTDCGLPNQEIEQISGRSVMTSAVQTVPAGKLMVKRAMDIAGALVGLVLTGIAFLIFAPIIYFQSKGPIFYAQTRVGLNGRRFRIYKFRSMYPDADARKEELIRK